MKKKEKFKRKLPIISLLIYLSYFFNTFIFCSDSTSLLWHVALLFLTFNGFTSTTHFCCILLSSEHHRIKATNSCSFFLLLSKHRKRICDFPIRANSSRRSLQTMAHDQCTRINTAKCERTALSQVKGIFVRDFCMFLRAFTDDVDVRYMHENREKDVRCRRRVGGCSQCFCLGFAKGKIHFSCVGAVEGHEANPFRIRCSELWCRRKCGYYFNIK